MEAARSSETFVSYGKTTQRYNPEDGGRKPSETLNSYGKTTRRHNKEDLDLNTHRRENIKSRISL